MQWLHFTRPEETIKAREIQPYQSESTSRIPVEGWHVIVPLVDVLFRYLGGRHGDIESSVLLSFSVPRHDGTDLYAG